MRFVLSAAALLVAASLSIGAAAQSDDGRIWNGVFTTAQAERGKAHFVTSCERCHGADLNGVTAPSLKGARFLTSWDNQTLYALYTKIRDSMPPNFGTALTDENKLDVVAFLLQSNGFPAAEGELKIDAELLDGISIVQKGVQRPANIPNFSVVQVVGCLAEGPNKTWVLRNTSSPAPSRDQASTPDQLKTAAAQALGSDTFRLVSVSRLKPETHKGHKVEAKGLLYRDAAENRLNVTVLDTVADSCSAR